MVLCIIQRQQSAAIVRAVTSVTIRPTPLELATITRFFVLIQNASETSRSVKSSERIAKNQ